MTINPFITTKYLTVSLQGRIESIALNLTPETYFVVLNNDKMPVGIFTYYDYLTSPRGLIRNCSFVKPRVSPEDEVVDVFQIMAKEGTNVLPVYKKNSFVGIVTHAELSFAVLGQCRGYKQLFKKVIRNLRNPIANLLGITTLLRTTIDEVERLEIVDLATKSCKNAVSILCELEDIEQTGLDSFGFQNTELNSFFKKCIHSVPVYAKEVEICFEASSADFFYPVNRIKLRQAVHDFISDVIRFAAPFTRVDIQAAATANTYTLQLREEQARTLHYVDTNNPLLPQSESSENTHHDIYLLKNCIEDHNGKIWIENLKELGTIINIQFRLE